MALGVRAVERFRSDLVGRVRGNQQSAAPPSDDGAGTPPDAEVAEQGHGARWLRVNLPKLDMLSRPALTRPRRSRHEPPKSPASDAGIPTLSLPDAHSPVDEPRLASSSPASGGWPRLGADMSLERQSTATPPATNHQRRSDDGAAPPLLMTGAFQTPESTAYTHLDAANGPRQRYADEDHDDDGPHPKHFLFCFPWVKSRRLRTQILSCFVSGIFLVAIVAIYTGLSVTNNVRQGELTVMLVLVILTAGAFFAYSLTRLLLIVFRPEREARRRAARAARVPDVFQHGGYVVPPKPIPVVLARDEEAVGAQTETLRPPAYGLWRESVRVDPNRLFWQRSASADTDDARPAAAAGPRPPSYASDDGVSYVMEMRPRSMAPPPNAPSAYPTDAARVADSPGPWSQDQQQARGPG